MAHVMADKNQLLARVRRIAGQVAAIERSLAGDASCSDILQQVAAVRGAVSGLMEKVVGEHLREHVARPGLSTQERAAGADELIALIRRYSK